MYSVLALESIGRELPALMLTTTGPWSTAGRVFQKASNPYFKFIRQDVSRFICVPGSVEFVFHFASPASPVDYLELPIPTLKVGALGTHNSLGLAKDKGATFFLASTSECYGDPLVHPQNEDYWGN